MRHSDYAIFDVVSDPKAPLGASIKVTQPQHVLKVRDEGELAQKLESFKDFHSSDPNEMLDHVEKTRPALRYYCQAYETGVPDWLTNDAHLLDLSPTDKKKLYGTDDVRVREFRPIVKKRGEAHRASG